MLKQPFGLYYSCDMNQEKVSNDDVPYFAALALIGLQTTVVHSSCDEDTPVSKEVEPSSAAVTAEKDSSEPQSSEASSNAPIPRKALQKNISKHLFTLNISQRHILKVTSMGTLVWI